MGIRYKLRQTLYTIKNAFNDIKRIWEHGKPFVRGETFTLLDIARREVSGSTPEYLKDILSRKGPILEVLND